MQLCIPDESEYVDMQELIDNHFLPEVCGIIMSKRRVWMWTQKYHRKKLNLKQVKKYFMITLKRFVTTGKLQDYIEKKKTSGILNFRTIQIRMRLMNSIVIC